MRVASVVWLRTWLGRSVIALATTALAASCSSDDATDPSGKGGTGGSAATGGGGSAGDAPAGTGGTGITGGSGGTGPSGGTGATAGEAGTDAGADVSVDAGGGTAGDAGDASDGGCGGKNKICDDVCVSIDNPDFGCTVTSCTPCSIPNATAKCFGGQCLLGACAAGMADCNGDAADGCETTLASDSDNCNACGVACVMRNATADCVAGVCEVAECATGFQDCNNDPRDGCETDVGRDPRSCGGCNVSCTATPGASPFCQNGTCIEKACPIGLMDCDGEFDNGCETSLSSDANNCGYCGNRCTLPNAIGACVAGVCQPGSCTGGFLDCDGNPGNGCETDPLVNSLYCGGCNRPCVRTGTSSVRCEAGRCHAVCNTGGDCSHPAAPTADNGCETDVLSDARNCSVCGNVCTVPAGTAACTGGRCTIADCAANLGDCDEDVANGCETSLLVNPDNCGACGRSCSSNGVEARLCSGGTCTSSCVLGRANCSQPSAPAPDDGCEAAMVDDVRNCGGCGRPCESTNTLSMACLDGRCVSTCQLGYANCITPAAPAADDGCETDATLLSGQCGSCRNDCTRQGGGGSGLKCNPDLLCGCAGNNARCNLPGATGTCDAATDRCECGGTTCAAGEACRRVSGADACSCNSGAPCAAGRVCCQTPAGCFDLDTDVASCGACGRACPTGFTCSNAACGCAASGSCDAGGGGTCEPDTGRCRCGTTLCAAGQRCQSGGSCG